MEKYVREAVRALKPYIVNDIDYRVKLDANEGVDWQQGYNRYPDDASRELTLKLSKWLDKDPDQLMVGNGSSELIELILKTFLEPGEVVASFEPTFSMYRIFTTLYNGVYEGYQMGADFILDVEKFVAFAQEKKAKIVLVSNPNNPTGRSIPLEDVLKIVESIDGIVVLDEAYIEFGGQSVIEYVEKYDNLVVLRTFSKAIALAGIRLGYLVAGKELVSFVRRVKSPYNVNVLTQNVGLSAFDQLETIKENVAAVKAERQKLAEALSGLGFDVVPSDANFLLMKCPVGLWDSLAEDGVLIRQFGGDLEGYCRVTVGTAEENAVVLESIRRWMQ